MSVISDLVTVESCLFGDCASSNIIFCFEKAKQSSRERCLTVKWQECNKIRHCQWPIQIIAERDYPIESSTGHRKLSKIIERFPHEEGEKRISRDPQDTLQEKCDARCGVPVSPSFIKSAANIVSDRHDEGLP